MGLDAMTRADAVVIGGGIAGLSVAARLAKEMRVVVLEAEVACGYHASGRSVAFAHFGLGDRIVRTLTALSLFEFREMESVSGDPIASAQHPNNATKAEKHGRQAIEHLT